MAAITVGGAFPQVAFDRLLKNLKIRMSAINQLIDDAEDKETTNLAVKQFLHDLKDVVFDAEDVIDVIATQAHENEVSPTSWNPFDISINQKLEDVFDRMQCLLEQKDVFGLKSFTRSNSTTWTFRPPTTSLVDKSCVYGRDVDKKEIQNLLLCNDKTNGDVIAIVGMGGLGKTTLAQLVFDDYEINGVFKLNKVWICISEDFDVIKITKNILHKLTSQSYDTNDLDLLQTKLKEIMYGKKFLIALDDVWNENYSNWENLRRPFDYAASGSKIIVTTRSERVASVMRATSTYRLKSLPDEACWLLFAKHAFENVESSAYSTFEALGRKLVKKCEGLPLAAKVLGGLVGTKLGYEEWNEVLKSDIWDLSNEASDNILPVLRLSYHYLPSNLKRCFAFCSIVPKDYDFEKEKLVLLWMAENLLQDSKSKKRIDVGYEYLRDLESRSLIQSSVHKYFSMHDLVNDLAKSVSGEFYKSFDFENSFNVGEKTRHFSYVVTSESDDYEDLARFKGVIEAKRLRTFLPLLPIKAVLQNVMLSPLLRSEIWPQLNLLRSLTLAWAGIEKLPDSIGNLKLLRYLNLSRNYKLNHLPESVANLYNLEVLILRSCESLTKLPSKMRQLAKLNHLDIRDTDSLQKMPLQMGSLKDLDVLTDFVVGNDSGSRIRELEELKNLQGELRIRRLQNIIHPEDALVANLKEKSKLEWLRLEWDIYSDNSKDARIILENLRPHVNLKQLGIGRYSGTRLPDWSGHYSFVNLASIEVFYLKHCFDLSPLGQLPSLKSLDIYNCNSSLKSLFLPAELPNEIYHVGHFSALEKLNINGCPNFEYLDAGKWCAPKMTNLELEYCESLKVLPENMCNLFPSLLKLVLTHCQNLEALPQSGLPGNLSTLEIKGCKRLIANRSSRGLQSLLSLSTLKISDCEDLESFPEEGLLPSSLSTLTIERVPNLRSLNGKSFQHLTSLETLHLNNCPNLQCLPEQGLPTSLSTLQIWNCHLLESRCQREQGEDCSKIAHIPNILVSPPEINREGEIWGTSGRKLGWIV